MTWAAVADPRFLGLEKISLMHSKLTSYLPAQSIVSFTHNYCINLSSIDFIRDVIAHSPLL